MVTEKNMKLLSPVKYEYGNLKIGGGGFVTGITFHPTDSKTLYIRTDIVTCGSANFVSVNAAWQCLLYYIFSLIIRYADII